MGTRRVIGALLFLMAFVSSGCSYVSSTYGVHGKLRSAEQQIIECEYGTALDTLQRFTVIGSSREKQVAFAWMGAVYQEKMDLESYNHTVDRFLFSEAGRSKSKQEVVSMWNETRREIRKKRLMEIGQAECNTGLM